MVPTRRLRGLPGILWNAFQDRQWGSGDYRQDLRWGLKGGDEGRAQEREQETRHSG